MSLDVQYFWLILQEYTQTNLMVFPTLEHATYNWPWEDHGFSKSKPQIVIVSPFGLIIVIANAKRIGNCKRLNCIGESKGFIRISGRSTTSPWNFPLKIVASRMVYPWYPNIEWRVIKFIKDFNFWLKTRAVISSRCVDIWPDNRKVLISSQFG